MSTMISANAEYRISFPRLNGPYHQVRTIAKTHALENTRYALELACHLHRKQKRRSGGPSVYHPIRVALKLHALGVREDYILTAALLHDVLEDCQDRLTKQALTRLYALDVRTVAIVHILTKHRPEHPESYYAHIANSWQASLIKLADRADNLASMNGAFTPERAREYIEETKRHIIPLTTPTQGRNATTPTYLKPYSENSGTLSPRRNRNSASHTMGARGNNNPHIEGPSRNAKTAAHVFMQNHYEKKWWLRIGLHFPLASLRTSLSSIV